jgi:DNA-binding transcriptional MerR regulator
MRASLGALFGVKAMAVKDKKSQSYKISNITELTNLSADTLRYYEKIGLLKKVSRASSGVRSYSDQDLSRIRFIQRAKTMNFTLDEIAKLLQMRENPGRAKKSVRQLTQDKLIEVEQHLKTLSTLQKELTLLINLCTGSKHGCPIIEDINQK